MGCDSTRIPKKCYPDGMSFYFSKAWIRRGYPGSRGAARLGMSSACGRSKVWRSSGNSLPRKITKVAFPHLLGMLRRKERCQGTLLCSIPSCSMPAPAPCPWNSGVLSFYFLPMHSHFPEEQNSHRILAAQPTVTLSQLQEKTGNLGCWHSSWEFWAYKLLPAPIPAPDGCLEFPTFAPERKVFVESHGSIPELFHSLFPWEVGNVHPQHLLDEHGSLEPDPWT